jgi:hypothetical protein
MKDDEMGEACSMHGKLKMLTSLWSEILKRRDHLIYLCGGGRIRLEFLLMVGGTKFGIDSLE